MENRNYSKKREAILNKICSTKTHPTAEWVYHNLKGDYPDLSLATVYRNIKLLKDDGTIISVGTVAGQERFDGNPKPHGHFVCTTCKAVIDFDQPEASPELSAHLDGLGALVSRVELKAFGTCKACLEA